MLWVGLGASAGGLEALQALAGRLPADANATYLVAQHLSPNHETLMVPLVQRATRLKVAAAEHGLQPQPGTIYITPPNADIRVKGRRIVLSPPAGAPAPKPSVDTLLESLAEDVGAHTVAVILSGTGSDGARGIKSVHASGGICFAQDPQTAKYDGMPRAAIDTGCIDAVHGPEQIAATLARLASNLPLPSAAEDLGTAEDAAIAELLERVFQRTKVDLRQYKKATIKRRIARRIVANGLTELADYLELVRRTPGEVELLYRDILISVTEFLRDRPAFEALRTVIAALVEAKAPQQPIRVWNVGCATGEEAYTVAILFAEALGGPQALSERNLQVFATDIDVAALARARRGLYPRSSVEALPVELQQRYFRVRDDQAEVIKPLRESILFSKHNVIEDPPFMRIDLLCCRNVLIYFDAELQKRVYQLFHYALAEQGLLFLGKSESTMHGSDSFETVDLKAKIFRKRGRAFDTAMARPRYWPQGTRPGASRRDGRGTERASRAEREPLFESLVTGLADAGALVNDVLDVEWVFGDLTPFVRLRAGAPRMNLLDLAGDEHREEIRALAYKVLREKQALSGRPRRVKVGGELRSSTVTVYPMAAEPPSSSRLLIGFRHTPVAAAPPPAGEPADDAVAVVEVRALREELAAAKEHLQTVVEELETSNEELQSVNEELQSANEELQSSNEELETANEELQSANEELVTVNEELGSKTAALQRATARLRQVEDALDFPMLLVDRALDVQSMNRCAAERFARAGDERALHRLLPAGFDLDQIGNLTLQVINNGEMRSLLVENGPTTYWLRTVPFREEDGRVTGAVQLYIDYTERRRVELALAEAQKHALAHSQAKSAFLANVSHDIRTPLNAISNGAFLLRRMGLSAERADHVLGMVQRSAEDLLQLAEEYLSFSKIESGKIELVEKELDLHALIERVAEPMRAKAVAKGLSMTVSLAPDVPRWVWGDAVKIRQVLLNLLNNALKFTDRGGIELAVKGTHEQMGYAHLRFVVADTGVGIPPERIGAVFERFSQAHDDAAFDGTGLGLTIVRELVELMHGAVDVESHPGAGARFTVALPLKLALGGAPSRDAGETGVVPVFGSRREAERWRILIVDDSATNATILSFYLEYLGCAYDVVASGATAVEACAQRDYWLVFMDLYMGQMNGFEAMKEIRREAEGRGAPAPLFVALTAHIQASVEQRALAAGATRFVRKPVDIQQLRALIVELQAPARPAAERVDADVGTEVDDA